MSRRSGKKLSWLWGVVLVGAPIGYLFWRSRSSRSVATEAEKAAAKEGYPLGTPENKRRAQEILAAATKNAVANVTEDPKFSGYLDITSKAADAGKDLVKDVVSLWTSIFGKKES